MRPDILPRPLRYMAFGSVLLALFWTSVSAQTHAAGATAAREIDAQTARVARSALERAARAWGSAGVAQGGVSTAAGATVLTGKAAVAGFALAQAAVFVGVSTGALHVHLFRSGSIAKYGNPYGVPAEDIAFPLLRQARTKRAQPPVPKPYPVPEPAPAPGPDDDQRSERRQGRIYATYTRYNRTTGRYYSGRTSAVIDLDKDWRAQADTAVRARNGNRNPDEDTEPKDPGFERALLDEYAVGLAVDYSQRYRDAAYLAIRGREQQLIDFHGARRARERGITTFKGGAQSDTAPDEPLTENAIRAVAKDNPFGEIFHAAANLAFGQIAPYTGDRSYDE